MRGFRTLRRTGCCLAMVAVALCAAAPSLSAAAPIAATTAVKQSTAHSAGTVTPSPSYRESFVNPDPGNQLLAIACPTSSFCVAGDNVGNIFDSSSPSSGGWSSAHLSMPYSYTMPIDSIVCASTAMCIAESGGDTVWVSTDPVAGLWTLASIHRIGWLNRRVLDFGPVVGASRCVA